MSRDGNRIVFVCHVTPDEQLRCGDHVFAAMKMRHEHHENSSIVTRHHHNSSNKTTAAADKPELQKSPQLLTQTVLVDLGCISTTAVVYGC